MSHPILVPEAVRDGVVALRRQGGADPDPWAVVIEANPLTTGWALPELPRTARCVLWTGSVGDDHFARDLRTWGPAGMAALDELCDHLIAGCSEPGRRLLLRPHCRHVLSDVQRCLSFLMKREGQPVGLLIEPCALLEADMLPQVEDHLRRCFEVLGPRAEAVWLSNAGSPDPSVGADEEPPVLSRPPLRSRAGLIDPDLVLGLAREHVPVATPLVIAREVAP